MKRKRRALVTGAANGLGKSLVLQLLAKGYEVVAIDKDEHGLLRLHHDVSGSVIVRQMDFAERNGLVANCEKIVSHGPYDMVFLAAGISATGRFEKIPLHAHNCVLDVNANSSILLANRLATSNVLFPGSSLVFISSLSHATGYPGAASYAASKEAVAIYAKSIRNPLRKDGVHVCCAFPGPIRTDHAAKYAPYGSNDKYRMPPSKMASKIIRASLLGKANIYPGIGAKLARLVGALCPNWVTSRMRKQIFEKLETEVF